MGLDTVELVMAFEETFGIAISDEDTEGLSTVRNMVDYIEAKIRPMALIPMSNCLTRTVFLELRRYALPILRTPRTAFRPDAQLPDLIPKPQRTAFRRMVVKKFSTAVNRNNPLQALIGYAEVWQYATLRELVTAAANRRSLGSDLGRNLTRPQLEVMVWDILEEQLGIRRQDYSLESRFIQDMRVS